MDSESDTVLRPQQISIMADPGLILKSLYVINDDMQKRIQRRKTPLFQSLSVQDLTLFNYINIYMEEAQLNKEKHQCANDSAVVVKYCICVEEGQSI